jgi:hypothetical protein
LSHVIGNNVTLPCAANDCSRVNWLYIDLQTARQFKVYGGGQVKNKYKERITLDTGRATDSCSLILTNAQTSDSGWYVCVGETDGTVTSKRIVTLIVSSEYQYGWFDLDALAVV